MPEYFVYTRQGPYGIRTLSQLVQNGEVDNHAFVWTPGMASLEYAKKMPELKPWFEELDLKTEKIKIERPSYAEAKTIPAPQPVASPQAAGYKVAVNGQSTGPFSVEQLVSKIQTKEVSAKTLVWKPGMTQWTPMQTVADFTALFAVQPSEAVSTGPTAAPQQWEELPKPAAEQSHESEEFSPAEIYADEELPYQTSFQRSVQTSNQTHAETAPQDQPLSLLQEDIEESLPWTQFILPGVLVLLGGVLEFLALKTAMLAGPLEKLATLFAKSGEEEEIVVPLLLKLIPGGLFILAGILVLVITLLRRRSSEQFDPMQL
jgi:hypothetical protein